MNKINSFIQSVKLLYFGVGPIIGVDGGGGIRFRISEFISTCHFCGTDGVPYLCATMKVVGS